MARVKDRALEDQQPEVESKALIVVTQLPVIEERLRDFKAEVEATVAEAKSMVATAETVQAVKNRRAELNKQFEALEDQRKAVKAQIMAPYDRFNAVYTECISGPFKEANAALKATVDDFETELKNETLGKLKTYYAELCSLEGIDWLPFQKAMEYGNIKVSMADTKSATPRRLMDALGNVVSRIAIGRDDIRKMEDSAEIMAEFKVCLDAGKAAATVQERKRKVQEEKDAAERSKEWEAKRQEAIAKVEAAAKPAAPVASAPIAKPASRPLNKSLSFRIHFKTEEEYEKVKPILKQLKETLIKEGISYE